MADSGTTRELDRSRRRVSGCTGRVSFRGSILNLPLTIFIRHKQAKVSFLAGVGSSTPDLWSTTEGGLVTA